ncbi:MAG: hypothetical protein LUF89_02170 [Ruminococcus sp.]|nr:hypothetical protein [Ruminococcus sp.]
MDDTFMSKVFEDKACAELLLQIILQKPQASTTRRWQNVWVISKTTRKE